MMFNFRKHTKKSDRFGEIAVKKNLAKKESVEKALAVQQKHLLHQNLHKKLGSVLVEKGTLSPDNVSDILAEQKKQRTFVSKIHSLFTRASRAKKDVNEGGSRK
ncbi:MAG: hypothetical protein HQL28_03990 [Candidatus Omnitrophica bacterium]|nr:hypothetical protein [Candidatus Omnitrophota bacterium]